MILLDLDIFGAFFPFDQHRQWNGFIREHDNSVAFPSLNI